jgi:hypothetical protein
MLVLMRAVATEVYLPGIMNRNEVQKRVEGSGRDRQVKDVRLRRLLSTFSDSMIRLYKQFLSC